MLWVGPACLVDLVSGFFSKQALFVCCYAPLIAMSSADHGEALEAPHDFDGPVKNRRCTDCTCLLLLFACWTSVGACGFAALGWTDSLPWGLVTIDPGYPELLYRGVDHNG